MASIDPEVLDLCLRRLQTGQATVDECLVENPGQGEALESMLQLAAATKAQFSVPGASQSFMAHSPKRVMNVLAARKSVPAPPVRKPGRVWFGQPALRLAGILLALVLILGSSGAASAASNALPGDGLYGVKRGLERAALVLSLSAEGDAALHLEHASRRLSEVEQLLQLGRSDDIGLALEGYEDAVQKGLEIAIEQGLSLDELGETLSNHQEVLLRVLATAPEQAIPGLTNALDKSHHGKDVLEQIRSGEHPSEQAPGQMKKTPEAPEGDSDTPPGQDNPGQGKGGRPDQPPGEGKKDQSGNPQSSD